VSRAIITSAKRTPREPLYDLDARGACIEVFYADLALARSFAAGKPGWFHWSCLPGCLPDAPPVGPFPTSYAAYRDALRG
jgi:hypothetical protein